MRYVYVAVLVLGMAAPGVAWGQSGTSGDGATRKRIQFIDMGEYFVRGKRQLPTVELVEGHRRPRFKRLLDLRRSFVKEIVRSAESL